MIADNATLDGPSAMRLVGRLTQLDHGMRSARLHESPNSRQPADRHHCDQIMGWCCWCSIAFCCVVITVARGPATLAGSGSGTGPTGTPDPDWN